MKHCAHLCGKQNIFSAAKFFDLPDLDDPKDICSQALGETQPGDYLVPMHIEVQQVWSNGLLTI